jgi:hypothetical protein
MIIFRHIIIYNYQIKLKRDSKDKLKTFTPFYGKYKTGVKFYFHVSVNYKLRY